MRKTLLLFVLVLILPPHPVAARWIGDMARDYTWRLEQERISRDSVSSAREKRIQERKENALREGSRSRLIPLRKDYDENEALLRRSALRTQRLRNIQVRGATARVIRTSEERERFDDVRMRARFDARRRADLSQILDVLILFVADPSRDFADLLPTEETEICRTQALTCDHAVQLDDLLMGSGRRSFPMDPSLGMEGNGTGYFVEKVGAKGLRVSAPAGNGGEGIEIEYTAP